MSTCFRKYALFKKSNKHGKRIASRDHQLLQETARQTEARQEQEGRRPPEGVGAACSGTGSSASAKEKEEEEESKRQAEAERPLG